MLLVPANVAHASDYAREPWSVSIYLGPATTKYFGAVFQSFRMQPNAAMLGVATNGRLLNLGWGIALAGEGQITGYYFGHRNVTLALGAGFQINEPFGFKRTTFSIYDGPSYSFDPPYTVIYYHAAVYPAWRKKWENYVSVEYAVELPGSTKWDGVFRFYHRSGAWGLYNSVDDDGMAFGLGVRYRF